MAKKKIQPIKTISDTELEKLKKKVNKILHKKAKGKFVEIVFENVDVMEIPYDKVKLLVAEDIRFETSLKDCQRLDMKGCKAFFIIIDGNWASGTHYEFGMKDYDRIKACRLQSNDITSFNYKVDGKVEDSIYVSWGGNSDYTNAYQMNGETKEGDIWISIGDKDQQKKLKDLKKSWGCK